MGTAGLTWEPLGPAPLRLLSWRAPASAACPTNRLPPQLSPAAPSFPPERKPEPSASQPHLPISSSCLQGALHSKILKLVTSCPRAPLCEVGPPHRGHSSGQWWPLCAEVNSPRSGLTGLLPGQPFHPMHTLLKPRDTPEASFPVPCQLLLLSPLALGLSLPPTPSGLKPLKTWPVCGSGSPRLQPPWLGKLLPTSAWMQWSSGVPCGNPASIPNAPQLLHPRTIPPRCC